MNRTRTHLALLTEGTTRTLAVLTVLIGIAAPAAVMAGTPAAMTDPASSGDYLDGTSHTFQWDAGVDVDQYRLWVGTTLGDRDIYNESTGLTRQATVTGLPTDGSTIYVRLNSYIAGVWEYNEYTYNTYTVGDPYALEIETIAEQGTNDAFSVTVNVLDAFGSAANVSTNTGIALSKATGAGTLGGTLTGTITAGTDSVTISGITYDQDDTGVSITATRTSGDTLVSDTSNTFDVVTRVPTTLAFGSIASQQAGVGFSVIVKATDNSGNLARVATNTLVELSVNAGTGDLTDGTYVGIIPSGSSSVTINNVVYNKAESGVTLDVVDNVPGTLASATSNAFDVSVGPASNLQIATITNQKAGDAFDVTINTVDQYGNAAGVTQATPVTLSLSVGSGALGGTLSATIPQSANTVTISGVTYNFIESAIKIAVTRTGGDVLIGAVSNAFDVGAGSAHHLTIDTIATPQTSGSGFTVTVRVEDQYNNSTTVSGNTTVTLTAASGTGTLGGTTTGTINSGGSSVAINGVTYDVAETMTIRASATGLTAAVSNTVTVQAGAAAQLVVQTIADQTAGQAFNVVVNSTDAAGNLVNIAGPTTITLSTPGGTADLVGAPVTGAIPNNDNTVTISATYNKAEAGVTVRASGGGLTAGTSNAFTVTADSANAISVTTPGAQVAGVPFDVDFTIVDSAGNPAPVTGPTLFAASKVGGTGTLSGTLTTVVSSGSTGTISGIIYDTAEAGTLTIRISDTSPGALTAGTSGTIDVTGGTPTALAFVTTLGPTETAGSLGAITIKLLDQYGNDTNAATNTAVTLGVEAGNGTLGGTVSGTITSGNPSVAINAPTYTKAEAGVQLNATATGLTKATSATFTVQAATADTLTIDTISSPQGVGNAFSVTVRTTDAYGNPANVTGSDCDYTLARSAGTGSLGGTTTGTISVGSNNDTVSVSYDTLETGVTIGATAVGYGAGTSNAFDVGAGTPTKLLVSTIGEQGTNVAFSVTVTAADAGDNPSNVSAPVSITLTKAAGDGAGGIAGTTTGTIANGNSSVTITGVKWDTAETNVQIQADDGGPLTAGSSAAFDVVDRTAAKLSIGTIADQGASVPFSITVDVLDASDNPANVSGDTDLTLSVLSGTGSLTGTTTGTISSGTSTVTLTGVKYDTVENSVQLRVQTNPPGGLTQADSNAFNVTNAPAQMTNPASDGDTLTGTTVTFTWDTGAGITSGGYQLKVGTTGAGSSDIYSQSMGTATSAEVTGLPSDGSSVNVRLSSEVAGVWQDVDYTYIACNAGDPVALEFATVTIPGAGDTFSVTVDVIDALGDPADVTQDTDLALSLQAGTGALGGTLTGTITSGGPPRNTYTFNNITYDTAETGVQLKVTATSGDTLTSALSNTVDVTAGTPSKLLISDPGAQRAGVDFSITVTAADQYDNPSAVTGDEQITLSLQSGAGNLNGTKVASILDGESSVTFTGLSFDDIADVKVIRATDTGGDGLTQADTPNITVTAGPADRLAIATIADTDTDSTFSVTVNATDQYGNNSGVLWDTTITLSVKTGTGTLGGTLVKTMTTSTNAVTFNGLSYDTVENNIELEAVASDSFPLTAATSNTFNVTAGTPAGIAVQTVSNTPAATDFTVVVWCVDASGNQVNADETANIVLTATGGGTFGGTGIKNRSLASGSNSVSFPNLQLDTPGQARITATHGGTYGADNSNYFQVTAGSPAALSISTISDQRLGVPFDITVTAVDSAGNTATVTGDIAVTVARQTGTGTLTGGSGTISSGSSSVTITGATYDTVETGVVLRASGGGLTVGDSNAFDVTAGLPAQLAVVDPGAQQAGEAFDLTVKAQDSGGNDTNATSDIALVLTVNNGTGTLDEGTSIGTISSGTGQTTITGVIYDTKENGVTIDADATGMTTGTSAGIDFAEGPASKLQVGTITVPGAGEDFSVTVQSTDQYNNPSNVLFNTTVTLTVKTGTGSLSGSTTGQINTAANSVTIGPMQYDTMETGVVLTATASDSFPLTADDSDAFVVGAGSAAKLLVSTIADQAANTAFDVTVTSLDQYDNVTNVSGDKLVTLTKTSSDGSGTIGGVTTGTISDATSNVTISGVTWSELDTAVIVNAAAPGLTADDSNEFDVTAGPAAKLAIAALTEQRAGVPFGVTVNVLDTNDDATTVTSDTEVTLSLNTGSGNLGGTLTGTVLAGTGSVTISGVTYDDLEAAIKLDADATGLSTGTSAAFDVAAGPAALLEIAAVGTQTAGSAFNVTVNVTDQYGHASTVTEETAVELTLDTGNGTLGGTLTGTISAAASSGTVTGVTYDTAETGVKLAVARTSGDALSADTSDAFEVVAASANALSITTVSTQTAGAAFNVVVNVLDQYGNSAAVSQNTDISLAVKTGTGTLGGTTTGTINISTGTVTITGVTYDTAETGVVLTASVSSGDAMTAADTNAFDVTAGTPTKLQVAAINSQYTDVSFSVTVTALDANDNAANVSGDTSIALTLKTGTGTLGGTVTGTITSGSSNVIIDGVTYDTAETGVVLTATDTSPGTLTAADSAAFDVIAQKGSMTTPANSGDSLTGTSFTFVWAAGYNVTQYRLWVGTTAGGQDIANQSTGTATQASVTGLPSDGSTVYVRLNARINDSWVYTDYTYTAVLAGTPDRLAFETVDDVGVDVDFSVTVKATDPLGAASNVSSDTTITIALKGGTGTGSLTGTLSKTMTSGTSSVTFSGIEYDTAESGMILTATASGGDTLTATESNSFAAATRTADRLTIATIGDQGVGDPFTVVVSAADANGNTANVAGNTDVTLAKATGTGSLSGTLTKTIGSGDSSVSFSGLTYDTIETNVSLTATDGGSVLTTATSNTFDVTAGAATDLKVATLSNVNRDAAFDVTVEAVDQFGNTTNLSVDTTVTLTVATGTGSLGGTTAGTITAGSSSVTISGVTYDTAETGVSITASDTSPGSLVADTSNTFNVETGLAEMINPASDGATLSAASHTFVWSEGTSCTYYRLWVGSTAGGSDISNETPSFYTGVSQTVTGLPVDGSTIYVRLFSYKNSSWAYNDYSYTAATAGVPSALAISNLDGIGTDVEFDVRVRVIDEMGGSANVSGDTTVVLSLATGNGSLGGTLTGTVASGTDSVTFTGITYDTAESGVSITATDTSPGTLTADTSNTFTVADRSAAKLVFETIPDPSASTPFNVTVYAADASGNPANVSAGTAISLTKYAGSGTLGGTLTGTITAGTSSVTITGVTYDTEEAGVKIQAAVDSGDSLTAGISNPLDIGYDKGTMTSPAANGDELTGSSYTFDWSDGTSVTQYRLWVGTAAGAKDIYNESTGSTSQATVTGLPTDGSKVYVRLNAYIGGVWLYNDYEYYATTVPSGAAQMVTPASDGDTLTGASYTFVWNAGTGVSQYRLWVGTTSGGKDIYNASTGTTQSATVTGLPGDGSTVYVRLNSYINGAWYYNEYTYTAATIDAGQAAMTTPASDGATLTGASYTFQWNSGTNVTQYRLWVGTTVGGTDIYNASTGTTQSATVTGLPIDGSAVYVRLNSYISGTWYYRSYQYVTAGGPPAPPAPPVVLSAVSRKTHGSDGVFDIDLLTYPAIESRQTGPSTLLVEFDTSVTGFAGLDPADVELIGPEGTQPMVTAVAAAGNLLTIEMTQTQGVSPLTISFPGIVNVEDQTASDDSFCFQVIPGDVNADGQANVFDLFAVRNGLGLTIDQTGNFRTDVNATGGVINVFDLFAVRNSLGQAPSAPCP